MKYTQFKVLVLNEASDSDNAYYKSISFQEMVEIYKKHCSGNKVDLYRGTKSDHRTYNIIEGQKGKRRSENTSNHYTEILDELIQDMNKEYPLRSASIIATTRENYAKKYGDVYSVIPYDDTWIGIVPSEDIWDLELDGYKELIGIQNMNELFIKVGIHSSSISDIAEDIESLDSADFEKYFGKIFKSGESIEKQIREMYSPKALGLKFEQSKDYKGSTGEVWIGGKCLLIKSDQYEQLVGILDKIDDDHVILFKKEEYYNVDMWANEYVDYADDEYEPELIDISKLKIIELGFHMKDKVDIEDDGDFYNEFDKHVKPSMKDEYAEFKQTMIDECNKLLDYAYEFIQMSEFADIVEYLDCDGFKLMNDKYNKDYEYFIFHG